MALNAKGVNVINSEKKEAYCRVVRSGRLQGKGVLGSSNGGGQRAGGLECRRREVPSPRGMIVSEQSGEGENGRGSFEIEGGQF